MVQLLAPTVVVVLGALVTAALVIPVRRLCVRFGLVVPPGPRRIHLRPMPVLGGIAMVAGLLVALAATWPLVALVGLQRSPFESLRLGLLLAGLLLVFAVSLIDDLRDLPALPRLLLYVGAALIAVGPYLWDARLYPDTLGQPTEARGIILTAFNVPFIDQVHLHNLSPWLAIAATVFWIVGTQTAINWADGLDGLAAGVTLIAAAILGVHALTLGQVTVALVPLALAGVCIGFLPFNWHPARIFMGDCGAQTIGYVLAISAILGGAKLATALLVLGIPLIDGAWMIISRTVARRGAMHADRAHLHHRLLEMHLSQRQIVGLYCALSAAFGSIGLLEISPAAKLAVLVVLGLVVLGLIGYASIYRRPTTTAGEHAGE